MDPLVVDLAFIVFDSALVLLDSLLLVFQGRPKIAGIEPGSRLVAEGMVGAWGRRPAMLNPAFELVAGAGED